ncbi:type 1 glutamine amidotransferase [Stackebrandtia nassauensis]|uniref:Glutamine amidotransferase class-I n=1 Tax=Stackebrandtia nassauensis (strain DSM 44728 / CIP 108903 / NRRL B-16338 / NBRC 102104 / LLR-40K-21) TaxID=446470 RepID=D3Q562_STANL|nr:type 1 glutamine amidotransferase [Stackebrandtia nassauensis]ADD44111.1 glutamine amidotransferase class-I [Stackebrandtia nassauensis DSM 44728]
MTQQRTRPTAIVVQNGPKGGPGRVGEWLAAEGIALDVVHGYQEPVPERLEHDAVIVLGGGYLPDADDKAPWLAATRTLVRQALDTDTPVLGICLGGQLLAHVAGGVVEGDVGAPENGSTPVTIRPQASDDPLFGSLPPTVPAIEHHVDAITALPPDAIWLAETDRCPYQAFRVGRSAWGTQFHPEIDPDRVRRWDPEPLREQGFDPEQVYAGADADDEVARAIWEKVTRRFATVVHDAARA